MRRAVLDTNLLLNHWRAARQGRVLADWTPADAEVWADQLTKHHRSAAILTPIYLEVVGGVNNRHEMELTKAFLSKLQIVDRGNITEADWIEARRLAERIPWGREPRPRGAVDCLIRTIANRLRYDIRTADAGMPR
ncbi:hypothetical protein BH23PLA1_BH23PLA1_02160 [soil metagenome]